MHNAKGWKHVVVILSTLWINQMFNHMVLYSKISAIVVVILTIIYEVL